MQNFIKYKILLFLIPVIISCKKILDVGPPKTEITAEKAFADDQSATAVLLSIYYQFNSFIAANVSRPFGIYTDELSTTTSDDQTLEYYTGFVSPINNTNLNLWKSLYSVIYQSNSLLENIENSPNVTPIVKDQLKGETLFLRALSYFYLINTYGDVPLLLTTKVSVTSTTARNSISEIYTKIESDLIEAKNTLPESYLDPEKIRAGKWAAVALLSRVYLYQRNWPAAESEAHSIITSGNFTLLDNPNDVFFKNSSETILQFWTIDGFTVEGPLFIPSFGSIPTYPITNTLINSFEGGDQRKTSWINSIVLGADTFYYPYKYKNESAVTGSNAEYLTMLRLGEQYLIRAEARASQNNISGSQADLNIIRNRAGLSNTTASDKASLLSAIEHERQVELFCEWGHRFYDLKRNGHINQILSLLKSAWRDASALLPIPLSEILNNPKLRQNPGY